MKYIIIVPDGMFDLPIAELNNQTPLEVANTTNMNYMAQHGWIGGVRTIPEGMNPGSDVGNLSLMGYNPKDCLTGRAPLEAANQNIILEPDQIAFRCNMVTVGDNTMIDYSAGHIPTKQADILIRLLNEHLSSPDLKFYLGKSYRHLLVMRTKNVQDYMRIKTFPPHDIMGKNIKDHLPQGPEAEKLVHLMEESRRIFRLVPINDVRVDLKENPADQIWLWGQGTKPNIQPFKNKFGVDGSVISAVDLVNGIGRLAGLEIIDVPGATGYYDTNYLGKAEHALKSLKKKDFVYIHIEAPDEAGHNGDYKNKIAAIEKIDQDIVGTILNQYNEHDDVRILVLPDHPTPVSLRTHTADPVGFIMFGKNVPQDGAEKYSEVSVKEKGLKFESGEALIHYFMSKNVS